MKGELRLVSPFPICFIVHYFLPVTALILFYTAGQLLLEHLAAFLPRIHLYMILCV